VKEWTEDQWRLFHQAYQHEIDDSRLAHKVIPMYELASSARSVSADTFDYATGAVDDVKQIPLEECQETFNLTTAQTEDEDLSSAQVIVRRTAQRMAFEDDKRVFRIGIRDAIDGAQPGSKNFQKIEMVGRTPDKDGRPTGDGIVSATAAALAALDGDGYRSGYVMVTGPFLYRLLHTRALGAADLPVIAVRGLLGEGPVHRSTALSEDEALVLSVGSGRIDRAVAVAPTAEFLRVEKAPKGAPVDELYSWRLYQKFITRFKETKSAVLLRLEPEAQYHAAGKETSDTANQENDTGL
jgi:hypothetical protein